MIDLLLGHYLDPGNCLVLTAAVRELNLAYPGEYRVAVDISVPEIWENNPWVVPVKLKPCLDACPDRYLVDANY